MKKLNMFTRLPTEDQTLVLDLCAKSPYYAVVEQVAKPREEGGLSLTTSESSLCKFFTRRNPEAVAIQTVGNYAAAVQVNQQAHGEANFEAILALVQNRILTGLPRRQIRRRPRQRPPQPPARSELFPRRYQTPQRQ